MKKSVTTKLLKKDIAVTASMLNSKLTQAQCSLNTFAEAEGQIIYS